ncbi:MAG: hypothetical protein PHC61_16810, partial [Chitinivibrionales bacterium]|nr:hypothetical protein [Chitinivibrionales bacterium]
VFLLSSRLQAIVYAIIDALPLPKKDTIEAMFRETLIETKDVHIILPVVLISVVVQVMRIGVHILCGGALGLLGNANILYFFILVPVTAMLMVLPLPFGVRESVGGALFAYAGFPLQAAVVMGFLSSLVGIGGGCIGGILFVFDKTHFTRKKT